ncbi:MULTISPECIES: single-stranded DNA-binding protein [Lacticaseibacillus]|uniref:Single-stranded DNA-binding protein n=2 Tax=Lacticaseibacillus zeae TaxID=57037 RepID=A0A5R8M035_LACZE|nr:MULTISPECIES: single-stranded DNA-binding protein [Lacticaseibacillus]OFR98376.1 single-stranded DNA-binding protein [Lactobacillus sp. HMSC068F07]KLI75444.1 single-stranded DNA-binding protein [Lacticaseibacillus casei]MDE3316844.1 single-stranded DNA-binding protein [Lacticaseibacillus zeae]OLS04246.1 single-stranded DNA-binding protein [Lacticaseibacillus casei]QVI32075.1 single-stranded DNA-binding protein [Lacticaseibacillus zeae]
MLNCVSLTGRLTKEPEVFKTAADLELVRFTLAVDRVFKNKTGQRETDFIECVIFGKRALTFASSTTKGSLIGVAGRISNNHFENKQGEQRWRTSVVVDNFAWLESRAVTESRRTGTLQATGTDGMPAGDPSASQELATDDLPF